MTNLELSNALAHDAKLTLTKRGIFPFGARLSLLIVNPTRTHVRSKRTT